jgi:hypothetical protein
LNPKAVGQNRIQRFVQVFLLEGDDTSCRSIQRRCNKRGEDRVHAWVVFDQREQPGIMDGIFSLKCWKIPMSAVLGKGRTSP